MATSIWGATSVTPAATDRLPVDTGVAGTPSRWTAQQVSDIQAYVGGTVNALGSVGTNQSVAVTAGRYITATATGNIQFTFTSVPASGLVELFLQLTNGGAHTISFAATVNWAGGTTPTLQSSGTDLIRLYTVNGGTSYIGELASDEYPSAASTTAAGIVELAIASEVDTGTDATRAMTPDSYRDSTPYYASRSANFTLAQTDMNTEQQFDSASNYVCTIDTNANVAIATQSVFMFSRTNTGTATIDAVAGVTINGVDGASHTIDSYGVCFLRKVGTNAYLLAGQFT